MPLRPNMQPQEYLEVLWRRKWVIVFSVLLVLLGASVYCIVTPKLYQSSTTILVVPQRVPENYVRSTVSIRIEDRLASIQQQVLSRTRISAVMEELGLFKEDRNKRPLEEVVNRMRSRITIHVRRNDTFTLSYIDEDPRVAMLTASRLASFFIDENLKNREQQAVGTADFLVSQLKQTKKRLEAQEARVRDYKTRHMGELPQQLQANLQILSRLQDRMRADSDALRSAEDRKTNYESQISSLEAQIATLEAQYAQDRARRLRDAAAADVTVDPRDPAGPFVAELNSKRSQVAALGTKYTGQYPEIRRLKREISDLESRIAEIRRNAPRPAQKAKKPGRVEAAAPEPQVAMREREEIARLKRAIAAIDLEIASTKRDQQETQRTLIAIEARVENSPKREQEMIALNRDYDNLRRSYDDLLRKKLDAEISENLEKRQKGEQFQILDPANLPHKPFVPNRGKIFGFAAFGGLFVAFAAVLGLELGNSTLRGVKDFKHFSSLPLLAAIPRIYDRAKERRRRIQRTVMYGGLFLVTSGLTVFLVVAGDRVRALLQKVW